MRARDTELPRTFPCAFIAAPRMRRPNRLTRSDSHHRRTVRLDRRVHPGTSPPIGPPPLGRELCGGLAALSLTAVIDDFDVGPLGERPHTVLMQPLLPSLYDQEITPVVHGSSPGQGKRKREGGPHHDLALDPNGRALAFSTTIVRSHYRSTAQVEGAASCVASHQPSRWRSERCGDVSASVGRGQERLDNLAPGRQSLSA